VRAFRLLTEADLKSAVTRCMLLMSEKAIVPQFHLARNFFMFPEMTG
jgi:hypothetical protein